MSPDNYSPTPIPSKDEIHAIVVNGQPEVLVKCADNIGQALARQVTSSQLRNIFGAARQIEKIWDIDPQRAYREAILLRPKLAYFAKRDRGRGMSDLEKIFELAIIELGNSEKDVLAAQAKNIADTRSVNDEKRFRFMRLVEFFEAIVAYHKKYGGN